MEKLLRLASEPRLFALYRQGVDPTSYSHYAAPWFTDPGFDCVLDVGANTGHFSRMMRALLPLARIYAFEPLPDCYGTLATRMGALPPFRAFNVALGSTDGTLNLNRNPYADASSFLPITGDTQRQFPFTAGSVIPVAVPVRRLDSLIDELDLTGRVFLKLDVQGYEREVLVGAPRILELAHTVQLEISFATLYTGAPTFDTLYQLLRGHGFEYRGCVERLIGPLDGAILQGDALFVRAG